MLLGSARGSTHIKCKDLVQYVSVCYTIDIQQTMGKAMYKEIRGFEGKYSVDEDGNVFSHINGRKLKQGITRGYHCVSLADKSRLVHRLVAEAFLPDFLTKPQVNHIDGNKTNNALSNLEMATASENVAHAYMTGLKVGLKGENHGKAKLSNADVITIKRLLLTGEMVTSIARKFGVSNPTISLIKSGKTWK